jgi:hypothetical protein
VDKLFVSKKIHCWPINWFGRSNLFKEREREREIVLMCVFMGGKYKDDAGRGQCILKREQEVEIPHF